VDKNLLHKLREWREKTARRENVELFRVISNQAVDEIASREPQSKEELLAIKGIKEKKFARYGEEILAMVRRENNNQGSAFTFFEQSSQNSSRPNLKIFEVGEYLDFLNSSLANLEARVKGEVTSIDERGNYIFFSIKGQDDESLINCFVWSREYDISGVKLEEGMEVVVWGYPNVYKPSGRLSFQTKLIELVGEGELKKAYDDLKRKLESEGVFAPERKKPLPRFVQNIGLITSHQGAAIGDFISNIGNFGYKIRFYDSRVEGKQAVFDLVEGVKWFNKNMAELDALVLVRGGGSLESLQAYNTEILVREIASSKIPVLAGIGHEQDVTLAALAADKMVSTPTAAALEIRKPWDESLYAIERDERNILAIFEGALKNAKDDIRESENVLAKKLAEIFERFRRAREQLKNNLVKIRAIIEYENKYLSGISVKLISGWKKLYLVYFQALKNLAEKIMLHDPKRQLRLGYSLVSFGGKIMRSVKEVRVGDDVDVRMSDGEIKTEIKRIYDL
jgi:exodeoxyribonuclease VII large subunit